MVVLVAGVLVLFWSRFGGLGLGMWHDEVVTVQRYVQEGPAGVLLEPYGPNNHRLFSLLAWASGELLAPTEAVWRLWGVVPGVASVIVLAWAVWRWVSPQAGAIVALLLTVSPYHQFLTPQVRGYGLAFLAAAGMVAGALLAVRRGTAGMALMGVGGWIGIATLPSMLVPFLGHALALALRPGLRRGAALMTGIVGLAALLWYAPVLGDLFSAGRSFGREIDVVGSTSRLAVVATFWIYPGLDPRIALVALVPIGVSSWLVWRRHRLLLADLGLPVLVGAAVSLRFYVVGRLVSPLLIPLATLLAVGIAEALGFLRRRVGEVGVAAATVLVSVTALTGFSVFASRTHVVPHENFKQAAEVVRPFDTVLASSLRPQGLEYYVGPRLRFIETRDVPREVCGAPGPLAYIEHPLGSDPVDARCLRAAGAREVIVPQRGRGEFLRVWLLGEGERPVEDRP